MAVYVLSGLAYLAGLLLLAMPPSTIPYFDGRIASVRLSKHALGLGLFMVGTMQIHTVVKQWTGYGFIISSSGLIIVIALLRIYMEKREP